MIFNYFHIRSINGEKRGSTQGSHGPYHCLRSGVHLPAHFPPARASDRARPVPHGSHHPAGRVALSQTCDPSLRPKPTLRSLIGWFCSGRACQCGQILPQRRLCKPVPQKKWTQQLRRSWKKDPTRHSARQPRRPAYSNTRVGQFYEIVAIKSADFRRWSERNRPKPHCVREYFFSN